MVLGSWSAAGKRPFVTARKPFSHRRRAVTKNGEGRGEGIKGKERERHALLSRVGWSGSFSNFATV